MNKDGFIADVVDLWREHACMDIDGCDFQELLIKHGLAEEVLATEADCETDWGRDYGLELGDPMLKDHAELLAMTRERVA